MTRRSRGPGAIGVALLLLLGAIAGALVLSVVLRSQEGEPTRYAGAAEVAVEVLNGCGLDGAARRAATQLRRGGFQVERVADADHFHYQTDIVVSRTGDREAAEAVALALGGATVIEQRSNRSSYTVTVIVGTAHSLVP